MPPAAVDETTETNIDVESKSALDHHLHSLKSATNRELLLYIYVYMYYFIFLCQDMRRNSNRPSGIFYTHYTIY